jgi:hypothetical protein
VLVADETFSLDAGRMVWREALADCVAAADRLELSIVGQECRKRVLSVRITLTLRGTDGALAAFAQYVKDQAQTPNPPAGPL